MLTVKQIGFELTGSSANAAARVTSLRASVFIVLQFRRLVLEDFSLVLENIELTCETPLLTLVKLIFEVYAICQDYHYRDHY